MNEQSIFTAALERPSDDRSSFLDQACGADWHLRNRVEQLLRLHEGAGSFLEEPPVAIDSGIDDETIVAEKPGALIGPYKLIERIGEGGFGVVFLAEQTGPVRREVALKVVKAGMETKEVVARFEAERQALAMMDHPNIAKVLSAGATESGRPYFVMELIRGIPITEYCDQCSLTIRERLALFDSVCRAVQHAHQKGVIHRDLKPSNVLIALQDGFPTPKIIDFGVAKAINQRLTEHTLKTRFAQMVGTPLYMSPEQAELSPLGVDTRSDIYSLGVLLYELLTGTTPFDKDRLHSASFDELRHIIREEEPPKPSTRVSTLVGELLTTVAELRRTEPRKLQQTVTADLDWIVMRCLEKDRNRRYASANDLAADLERYMHDEPVEARPPSVAYRFHKFVGRNRAKLVVLSCLMLAFVIMAGSIGWVVRSRIVQRAQLVQQVEQALRTADDRQRVGDWRAARTAVESAKGLIDSSGEYTSLNQVVERHLAEIEMTVTIERIRLSLGKR